MKQEIFNCTKCGTLIGGHNQYLHDGMCDDCYFKEYFPEEAQIEETDMEKIKRHCRSKPVQKENASFREFLLNANPDIKRIDKIVKEIENQISCPNGGECCAFLHPTFQKDSISQFIQNAEICPIIFNVLENSKEEFLEDIFDFENPDL